MTTGCSRTGRPEATLARACSGARFDVAVPRTRLQRALADNGGGQVAGGRWLRGVAGRCDRCGNSPVIALSAAAGDSSRKKDSAAVQVGADVTALLTHPGVFIPPRSFIQSVPPSSSPLFSLKCTTFAPSLPRSNRDPNLTLIISFNCYSPIR